MNLHRRDRFVKVAAHDHASRVPARVRPPAIFSTPHFSHAQRQMRRSNRRQSSPTPSPDVRPRRSAVRFGHMGPSVADANGGGGGENSMLPASVHFGSAAGSGFAFV